MEDVPETAVGIEPGTSRTPMNFVPLSSLTMGSSTSTERKSQTLVKNNSIRDSTKQTSEASETLGKNENISTNVSSYIFVKPSLLFITEIVFCFCLNPHHTLFSVQICRQFKNFLPKGFLVISFVMLQFLSKLPPPPKFIAK